MKTGKVNSLTKKLVAAIVAIVLSASAIIALCRGISFVSASAAISSDVERSGLGLSVNAVTTDYLYLSELKDGAPIFNTDWLASQVNSANYVSVNSTYSSSYKSSEFEEVAKSYLARFQFSNSVSAGVDLFLAAASFGFEVEDLLRFGFKLSSYYYMFNNQIERYTLSLPNYSTDLSSYKENLNSNYLNALKKVFSGSMTYKELFDTYGTHVVLKGVYGGTMNMFYRLASNKYDVGGYSFSNITSDINASITGVVNAGSAANFNITNTLDCSYQDVEENIYFTAHGGNPFTGTSISDFSNSFKSWSNSVASSPVLISASSDGLVPLWKLLPSKYSGYQTEFENEFKKYAAAYNEEILESHYHIHFEEEEFTFYYNRSEEYKINDQGQMNQNCDIFDLNSYPIGCDIIRAAGFKKVIVSVKLEMREQNKGYQHFYLYDSESTSATPIDEIKYEYGGTTLKKDYTYVTHTFKQIDLTRIINYGYKSYNFDPIVVRYNASGVGYDDWYNRNCQIMVTFKK